jgi:transcriptional regulator with XRE-family HTH domain
MMTAQQFSKGERVLVSIRGGAGRHEVEQSGVIAECAGKGAFVRLANGSQNFFYFTKIRRDVKPIVATTKSNPTFKLAEVARITPPKHFEPKPESAPPPRLGVPLDTSIGGIIFAARQDRGVMQEPFARAIGVSAVTLSQYERGLARPKDDELLKLAEVFEVDLTQLVEANERFLRKDAPEPKPPAALPDPAEGEYIAETERLTQGAPGTIAVERFQLFVERLADLAPIPADRAARHDWFERARGFYWESEGLK